MRQLIIRWWALARSMGETWSPRVEARQRLHRLVEGIGGEWDLAQRDIETLAVIDAVSVMEAARILGVVRTNLDRVPGLPEPLFIVPARPYNRRYFERAAIEYLAAHPQPRTRRKHCTNCGAELTAENTTKQGRHKPCESKRVRTYQKRKKKHRQTKRDNQEGQR